MGRSGRDHMGHRDGEGFDGHGIRGRFDDRWDPDPDPSHDLRDIYEDSPDPAERDYLWPETEEDDD
jgi:hypothetical protein